MTPVPTLTGILLLSWLAEALTEYLARPWLKPAARLGPPTDGQAVAEPCTHGDGPNGEKPPPLVVPEEACPRAPSGAGTQDKPPVLRYAAMALGILLAIAYRADLLALVGLVSPFSPFVGYVVTGLVIGRGSNFLHDLADRWLAPAAGRAYTLID
jgi:hypothetical protein